MIFFNLFEKWMRKIFPSTFTITIFLTILTFLLALLLTDHVDLSSSVKVIHQEVRSDQLSNSSSHILQLIGFWYTGLWNTGLLAFAIQMMLILVLGFVIASTPAFRKLIDRILIYCNSTSSAAFLVTLLTIIVSLFNWGLGLVFGAIFARKVGDYAKDRHLALNYPLIAACGYTGLMVWHGGISGSAPLKVAEPGHFMVLIDKNLPPVDFSQTVFSGMNLMITAAFLVILPLSFYFLAKKNPGSVSFEIEHPVAPPSIKEKIATGAEKLDNFKGFGSAIGIIFIVIAIYKAWLSGNFSFIDPNYLNFVLLGLGLILCRTIAKFLSSVSEAMSAAAGILIQFPLYFGIMGLMKYSGLVELFSGYLMNISNTTTFPLFTFVSAGIVNIFIPSGGGQWAIQGPIIVEAAQHLGVPLSKGVMALAYGDEITNMLQPFWALPLLGITGLKARDIIPYSFYIMIIGIVIIVSGLLLW